MTKSKSSKCIVEENGLFVFNIKGLTIKALDLSETHIDQWQNFLIFSL
jgi:hypothetical protein